MIDSRDPTAARHPADYRESHLASGPIYDATLSASPFDAYMARREAEILERVVPSLFPGARPRHLDFACGTGRITWTMAAMTAETVGVDVSESMLAEARSKCPGVRFVRADLTQDATPVGSGFDVATAFRFFGNAQDDLREAVLRTLSQLVRPGGALIVNSHRNPHSIAALLHGLTGGRHGMDLHFFKFRALLQRHGFEVAQVVPIGVWQYRSSIMATPQDPVRARRLEDRFQSRLLAPIAPDAVIVARRR